jgi:hypothetical protein
MQNQAAIAGLLGLRERPVEVTRSATIADSWHDANLYLRH